MGGLNTYCCLLLLLFYLGVFAQTKKSSDKSPFFSEKVTEKTHLDLNSDMLLSGETLLYKITIETDKKQGDLNQSKLAYVKLMGADNKTWFFHKIGIQNGSGAGSYRIPVDAVSGDYKLICYTNWSRNNRDSGYFVKDLLIINPFLKQEKRNTEAAKNYTLSAQKSIPVKPENSTNQISLSLDTTAYGMRKPVHIDLKLIDNNLAGDYLLAVRKLSPAQSQLLIPEKYLGLDNKNKTYLPEFRGELLSGVISTKNQNMPVNDKTVSFSIPGKNFIFKNVKTDSSGHFLILLDKSYNTTNTILQVVNKHSEAYHISLDSKEQEIFDQLTFKTLYVDPSLSDWLMERSTDVQIMNAYAGMLVDQKKDSITPSLFYEPYATRYKLDDYDRFLTMHETFTEIITSAAMRIDEDQVRLKVYNTENPFKDGLDKIDPLVLIDGIQIQDNSLVKNLDPKTVEAIDIVPQQYRYGPSYFSGIISIITKKKDFTLSEDTNEVSQIHLSLPIIDDGFSQQNYGILHNASRRPDYRVQLYWNPHVKLTAEDKQIQFYTSDQEGIFEVQLIGYDHSGNTIKLTKRFSVQELR